MPANRKSDAEKAARKAARKAAKIAATIASTESFDSLPPSAFVRLPVVCRLFDIAPATAWRWAESGRLPRARKIGERVSGWPVGELRETLRKAAA